MTQIDDPNQQDWKRFVWRWMGISLVLHLITTWFSVGHQAVDEYFQILEFLSYKRGMTPASDLAVEFHEKMRPWMQPFLYGQMVRAWEFIGVTHPFTWAWSFRLVTSLLGWAGAVGLAFRAKQWFTNEKAQRFCVIALALIWFFPALHARPSSEGLGGSAFLMGLVLLTGTNPGASALLGGGALLGLSFEARFQVGFMVAGLLAWLLLVARLSAKKLGLTLLGLLTVVVLGRWIDHWGYGEWVLSPWHYVEYNLLRGEVNRYGQSSFLDVFRMSFTESWPFLGFGLAIASIIAWIRHPKHPLTWSQVPFFLVHEAIAHKELRFFFPLAAAGPVLLTLSLTQARGGKFLDPDLGSESWPRFARRFVRWSWRFLLANNFVALIALLFMPFSRAVRFYQQIWNFIPQGTQKFEIFYRGTDPFHLLGNPVYFYHPPQVVSTPFESYSELLPHLRSDQPIYVFEPSMSFPPEAKEIAPLCHPVIQALPPWLLHLDINGWVERAHPWTLFECANRP